MGTNYYLIRPDTRCAHCGSLSSHEERLHIGKSSAGWHFTFNATVHKDAEAWKKAIYEVVAAGGWISTEYNDDEYARILPSTFWEMVKNKRESSQCNGKADPRSCVCVDGVDFCSVTFS